MDKFFERQYALELPKLRHGDNVDHFDIDSSFFEAFEFSPVNEGEVAVDVTITKLETHLDAKFEFNGHIVLNCDRCMEPYPHVLNSTRRVIFAYDEDLEFDTEEVILIEHNHSMLYLSKDLYDFVLLEIPIRKVPHPSVHICPPNVLEILGLNPDGTEKVVEAEEEDDEPVDPRWAALKNLKDKEK
ncbi:MAG: DUF177 domain-containing protein [Bacteroidota bacterium]